MGERRILTQEEKTRTQKGIEKNMKVLKQKKEILNYSEALIAKQKYLRKFDDDWREYLRMQKDAEDENIIKAMRDEIKEYEQIIKIELQKLKEGVKLKN